MKLITLDKAKEEWDKGIADTPSRVMLYENIAIQLRLYDQEEFLKYVIEQEYAQEVGNAEVS